MNCNKCLIFKLVFLILIFIVLIVIDRNKETFAFLVGNSRFQNERPKSLGYFSVVNTNDEDADSYDIEKLGPICVGQCVAEHGPNILFTNPDGDIDALKWNKENPTKGYCYRANSKKYPFECDESCQEKCGVDGNNPLDSRGEYDPENDFSQCMYDEKDGCIEKKLNMLSGQSCLTTIGCKLCFEKYAANLQNLNVIFSKEIDDVKKCEASDE